MKNWKTTLAGAIVAFATASPDIQAWFAGQPIDWRRVAVAGGLFALGYLAKDAGPKPPTLPPIDTPVIGKG